MAEGHDEVGYCQPPKHTRFKPGQSGNPKGKPRGSRGLRTELRSELGELVTITENGKSRRIPKRRIVIKALTAKALKGDVRAADKIMQLVIQAEGFEDPQRDRHRMSEVDRQIVEYLLGQQSDCPGNSLSDSESKSGEAEHD